MQRSIKNHSLLLFFCVVLLLFTSASSGKSTTSPFVTSTFVALPTTTYSYWGKQLQGYSSSNSINTIYRAIHNPRVFPSIRNKDLVISFAKKEENRRGIKTFFRWIKPQKTSETMSPPPSAVTTEATTVSPTKNEEKKDTVTPSSYQIAMDDVLFRCIEKTQLTSSQKKEEDEKEASFGDLLDAGTGSHSLRWIASLLHHQNSSSTETRPTIKSYTAVTADTKMQSKVLAEATSLRIASQGTILIGDWASTTPPLLCEGQMYDTILADYLIGSIDGFAPYYQDCIIERLVKHLKPGGRLYVVGLEPVPDNVEGDGDVVCRVRKVRDACILLAGHRCYREYPQSWIHRQIQKTSSPTKLQLLSSSQFPILYSHNAIVRQINVARSKLPLFPSTKLANEMKGVLNELEEESLKKTKRSANGRLSVGFDYVVAAEKVVDDLEEKEK